MEYFIEYVLPCKGSRATQAGSFDRFGAFASGGGVVIKMGI